MNRWRLHVRDFGAVGDGLHDDGPAIRAALQRVTALSQSRPQTGVRLLFDGDKRYRIGPWDERWDALPLYRAHRVMLDGNGCELLLHPKNMGFGLLHCEQVTLRRFVIDYHPLPFTQGEVTHVEPDGRFHWRLETGYPAPPDMEWVRAEQASFDHGCFVEQAPSRLYTHHWVYVASVEPIVDQAGSYRITPAPGGGDTVRQHVRPGQRFWFHLPYCSREESERRYVHQDGRCVSSPASCIQLRHAHRCLLERITLYASPRMGVRFDGCDDLVLRDIQVIRRPHTTRLAACNSDGIHGRTRRGPLIERCRLEALGDDSISVGDMAHQVWEQRAPDQVRLCYTDIAWFPSWLAAGDTLVFLDQRNRQIIGTRIIRACSLNGHLADIQLDTPIEPLTPLNSLPADDPDRSAAVTLAYRLPQSPVRITHCDLREQLKEGIRMANAAFVITRNRIRNTAYGVNVFGALGDSEVSRNTIDGAWPFAIGLLGPELFIHRSWVPRALDAPFAARITLAGNEIRMRPRGVLPLSHAITLNGYERVELISNRVYVHTALPDSFRIIALESCGQAALEGNHLTDHRANPSAPVHLTRMSADQVTCATIVYSPAAAIHRSLGINSHHHPESDARRRRTVDMSGVKGLGGGSVTARRSEYPKGRPAVSRLCACTISASMFTVSAML